MIKPRNEKNTKLKLRKLSSICDSPSKHVFPKFKNKINMKLELKTKPDEILGSDYLKANKTI